MAHVLHLPQFEQSARVVREQLRVLQSDHFVLLTVHYENRALHVLYQVHVREDVVEWRLLHVLLHHAQARAQSRVHDQASDRVVLVCRLGCHSHPYQSHAWSRTDTVTVNDDFRRVEPQLLHQELVPQLDALNHVDV